jgi:hypothetical protein
MSSANPTAFSGATFEGLRDGDASIHSDLVLTKCRFWGCGMSRSKSPELRTVVRRVHATRCETHRVVVGPAVFDEVVVDGLRTRDLLQLWGCVFRHVTLTGRVGRIMVSPSYAPLTATQAQQRALMEANQRFYADVDWALDISQVDADELELYGVPARLVRRDPETQVVVLRSKAQAGTWRSLDLDGTWWGVSLERLANGPVEDVVLAAPRRHRRFKQLVAGLQLLRASGVAEAT